MSVSVRFREIQALSLRLVLSVACVFVLLLPSFSLGQSVPSADKADNNEAKTTNHLSGATSAESSQPFADSVSGQPATRTGARHVPRPPIHIIRLHEPGIAPIAPFAIAGAHADYFGGPVISNVHVVQVLYGTGAYLPNIAGNATPTIGQFFTDITQSSFMDMLSEYTTQSIVASDGTAGTNQTIGHGFFDGAFTITPAAANNGTVVSDAQIQTELLNQVNAGHLPAPIIDAQGNNNTLYMIYFPPGKTITAGGSSSCVKGGFCAYHNSTNGTFASHRLFYGVLPDVQPPSACSAGCGGGTLFDIVTNVTSHEFSEAVTDPDVGPATALARPLAWIDPVNSEIGDICVAQEASVVANNTTYTVQQEFSNLQNDCVEAPPSFQITAGPDVTGGQSFDLDLRIVDSNGTFVLGGYNGTVHFTSSDPAAVLPADYAFSFADAGSHHFVATLNASGPQTITVTDTKLPGFSGSATLGVNVPNVAQFLLVGPANAPTGTPVTVTVTAVDSTLTLVPNYNGTVHFTSSDLAAVLPADTVLTNGTGAFNLTLNTSGLQNLLVADKAVPTIKGTTQINGIVTNANATTTTLTGPATITFGQTANFVMTVSGNSATPIGGTFSVTLDGGIEISGGISGSSNAPVFATGGTHTLYGNYFGNGTFLPSSSGPLTLVVNPGPVTLAVSASQSSAQFGAPVTFTARPTPSGSSRGFITFFDGNNPIGIIPASQAFFPGLTVTALPVGTHSITASLSGSPDFLPATSPAISEVITAAPAPNFSMQSATSSATISAGQSTTFQITTTSVSGFTGNVRFSCGNLPALTTCTFSPSVAFVSGTALTSTTLLTLKTTGSRASLLSPSFSQGVRTRSLWWAMTPFGLGLVFVAGGEWRKRKNRGLLLGLAVLLVGLTLASCGGGSSPPPPPPTPPATPTGTTVISITGSGVATSGAAPANPTQQLSLTVTVQ